MSEVLKLSRELGAAIQNDEAYKKLMEAKEANDNNEELQNKIKEYNMHKLQLNIENKKEDADKAKVDELVAVMNTLYEEIMGDKSMVDFKDANDEFEKIIEKLNMIVSGSINGENPFMIDTDGTACSGSCASCAGCH